MGQHFKPGIVFNLIAALAVILFPVFAVGQDSQPTPTPVTLWMQSQRGDPHYGPNFIELHTPCQNSEDCECTLSFKVINSPEFANYIASFGDDKVPVVYEVFYRPDGQPAGNRLASVGNWPADKFHHNEQLIGVHHTFKGGTPGKHQSFAFHGSADCFPLAVSVGASAPSQVPRR